MSSHNEEALCHGEPPRASTSFAADIIFLSKIEITEYTAYIHWRFPVKHNKLGDEDGIAIIRSAKRNCSFLWRIQITCACAPRAQTTRARATSRHTRVTAGFVVTVLQYKNYCTVQEKSKGLKEDDGTGNHSWIPCN